MANGTQTRAGDAGARIAEVMRDEIVAGLFAPGDRIRQDEIADRFGASRVPVREAIRLLEQEGLIVVKPNAGAWVARLTLAECEEIYKIRERIEPLLLSYSAPELTESDIEKLQELTEEISSIDDDTEKFLELDRELHALSYSRAKTTQLSGIIDNLWNSTAPYRRVYVQLSDEQAKRIVDLEHQLMVALLKEGDFEEAQRVLAGHIRRTRKRLPQYVDIFESF